MEFSLKNWHKANIISWSRPRKKLDSDFTPSKVNGQRAK